MSYSSEMANLEGINGAFLRALAGFAGKTDEFEFERRGGGDTTYKLHGKVVAVDGVKGTILIQRTRTSAGEIHEMGLSRFLSASLPFGLRFENRAAIDRNEGFSAKQLNRTAAVVSASISQSYKPGEKVRRSRFVGRRHGMLEGFSSERYVYEATTPPHRKVAVLAASLAAADKFMAMQDIFLPLDEMVFYAIEGRILWPAGIKFDRRVDPDAWSLDWPKLFDALNGIPKKVLMQYLELIHTRRVEFGTSVARNISDLAPLQQRNLVEIEDRPASLAERLERVPIAGLRQIIREGGSSFKAQSRVALSDALSKIITPSLDVSVNRLMRSPYMRVKSPFGLEPDVFDRAIRELRDSIFLMRQWIHATRELYREDELRQLVGVS